jgi:hypothetical protein
MDLIYKTKDSIRLFAVPTSFFTKGNGSVPVARKQTAIND